MTVRDYELDLEKEINFSDIFHLEYDKQPTEVKMTINLKKYQLDPIVVLFTVGWTEFKARVRDIVQKDKSF